MEKDECPVCKDEKVIISTGIYSAVWKPCPLCNNKEKQHDRT
ncbi:hypothetical protein [Enterococcus alishanensis]